MLSPSGQLNKLYDILQRNSSMRYVEELIFHIDTDKIYLFPPTRLEFAHAYETYHRRSDLRKITLSSQVVGYEELLDKLRAIGHGDVFVTTIVAKDKAFIVFLTEEMTKLVSILESKKENFKNTSELQRIYREKGLEAPGVIFNQKILLVDE